MATGFRFPPAVIVHGLDDARAALAPGRPVTLLSAPGAALYAGCGWWRALVRLAQAERGPGRAQDPGCVPAAGQSPTGHIPGGHIPGGHIPIGQIPEGRIPEGQIIDILDCADAAGATFAALRLEQRWLVLAPAAPGFAAAAAVAAARGGGVLPAGPPALDLAAPGAARALAAWLGPEA